MKSISKVYLVNIGNPTRWIAVPFGLAFISRALKIANMEFEVIDLLPVKPDKREEFFLNKIQDVRDGLFGFGIMLGNGNLAENLRYADIVKKVSKNSTLVFGGAAATAIPKLLLENVEVDYIVLGEGEERFVNLLKSINAGNNGNNIEGVLSNHSDPACKSCGNGHGVANLKKIKNLDQYSPPLYDVFDMDFYINYLKESQRCFDIAASRGCWANCDFCFKFIGSGYHSRSAESLLDEIKYVTDTFGHSDFAFTDENFFQNKKMFFDLMAKAKRKSVDFRFRCMTRVDNLDEEMTSALSDANCLGVSFGIESVNDDILDKYGKRTTVSKIKNKIQFLHKAGIEARGSFIIGFPEDTEEDFEAMYKFIDDTGLAGHCTVNYLTPLPATALYAQYKDQVVNNGEWEYIKKVDQASLYRDLVVNLTKLPDDVLVYHRTRIKELGQSEMMIPQSFSDFLKNGE